MNRLAARLLAATILPACSSGQASELAIPTASGAPTGPVVATAAPVASELPLPQKDPREATWNVGDALCMPAWATDAKEQKSLVPGSTCGHRPGAWIGPTAHRYSFNEASTNDQHGRRADACCYSARRIETLKVGRLLEGPLGPVLAPSRARRDWARGPFAGEARGHSVLAAAWLEDALEEHASIASFSAAALDLLALGAPAALVRAAHEAALDEIGHASACFALAARYGAGALGPGALRLPDSTLSGSLVELARRSISAGCVGETLAALEAEAAAALAEDPQVKAVLEGIAADEARHAELAVRIVAWAARAGSTEERLAIRRELELPRAIGSSRSPAEGLEGHGRLGARARRELHARAFDRVVQPTLRALADLVGRPTSSV